MRLLTDDASVDPKAVGLSTRTAVEIEAELARQACTVRLMGSETILGGGQNVQQKRKGLIGD